jgi:hypothetical protein
MFIRAAICLFSRSSTANSTICAGSTTRAGAER